MPAKLKLGVIMDIDTCGIVLSSETIVDPALRDAAYATVRCLKQDTTATRQVLVYTDKRLRKDYVYVDDDTACLLGGSPSQAVALEPADYDMEMP